MLHCIWIGIVCYGGEWYLELDSIWISNSSHDIMSRKGAMNDCNYNKKQRNQKDVTKTKRQEVSDLDSRHQMPAP